MYAPMPHTHITIIIAAATTTATITSINIAAVALAATAYHIGANQNISDTPRGTFDLTYLYTYAPGLNSVRERERERERGLRTAPNKQDIGMHLDTIRMLSTIAVKNCAFLTLRWDHTIPHTTASTRVSARYAAANVAFSHNKSVHIWFRYNIEHFKTPLAWLD